MMIQIADQMGHELGRDEKRTARRTGATKGKLSTAAAVRQVAVVVQPVRREAFGRGAEPWEVANVIVFLASDYSSYMTGEIVAVSNQHP